MIPFQRAISLAMAAAMVCVFLIPLAISRHQVVLAVVVAAVFFVYLAFNAWVFVRLHRSRRS